MIHGRHFYALGTCPYNKYDTEVFIMRHPTILLGNNKQFKRKITLAYYLSLLNLALFLMKIFIPKINLATRAIYILIE